MAYRKLKLSDDEVRDAWFDHSRPLAHAAREYDVSANTIRERAERLGLPPRPATKVSQQRHRLANITREVLEPAWSNLNIPIGAMADALGVTRSALSYKAKTLGLPSRKTNRAPQKKGGDALFTRMWLAGVSVKEIAEALGYAHWTSVGDRRTALGLPPRTRDAGRGRSGYGSITLQEFHQMELARLMSTDPATRRQINTHASNGAPISR